MIARFDPSPGLRSRTCGAWSTSGCHCRCESVGGCRSHVMAPGGFTWLPARGRLQVQEIRNEMNPGLTASTPSRLPRHLEPPIEIMRTGEFQLGLATDGDATASAPWILRPLCRPARHHGVARRAPGATSWLRGSVVKTVSTTQMLNRLAERYGLAIYETPVASTISLTSAARAGAHRWRGERRHQHPGPHSRGDGLLMGLLLAELVATRRMSLVALLEELMAAPDVGSFCYARASTAQSSPSRSRTWSPG